MKTRYFSYTIPLAQILNLKINTEIIITALHVLSLTILLITLGLLLDFIFRGNSFFSTNFNGKGEDLTVLVFTILSIVFGLISINILFSNHKNENKPELYLSATLLSELVLLFGIVILLFV